MESTKINSPINHTVLCEFRDDVSPTQIDNFFTEMSKLKTQEKVKGILSFSYGKHNSNEGLNQGFNYAMSIIFENTEARDAYIPHPEHERVKSILIPLLKDGINSVIAIDWAIEK